MSLTPRIHLDDNYVKGIRCAICGNPNLKVTHVEKFPDFVSCNRCGAAFVVEKEGSWVMYGKIPSEYPQTAQFALRQWTWLDAVAQRAADERESGSAPSFEPKEPVQEITAVPPKTEEDIPPPVEEMPSEEEVEVAEPTPTQLDIPQKDVVEDLAYAPPFTEEIETDTEEAFEPPDQVEEIELIHEEPVATEEEIIPSPFVPMDRKEAIEEELPTREEDELFSEIERLDDKAMEEIIREPPRGGIRTPVEGAASQEWVEAIQELKKTEQVEEEPESKPSSVPIGEPEPDKRFRVTIRGSPPKYPQNYCAHCLRTPVKLKAIMRGSLPDPNHPGKRKMVSLDLPFCRDCQKRMNARSDEERNARLLAFLFSGLIALIAIVATLALSVVDLSENLMAGLMILLVVSALGFSIPLLISLTWASRHPPPRDAAFVLSTLLVNESGDDLTEFEWRNPGYAELFRQVNQANAIGEVVPIQDRVTFVEVPLPEAKDKKEEQPKPKPRKKAIEGEAPKPEQET